MNEDIYESSQPTKGKARQILDSVSKWMPTYSQLLMGLLIMIFGLLTIAGAEISILVDTPNSQPSIFGIPRLDNPIPQAIMLFGIWYALVPDRVNRWVFNKVRRLIKGEGLNANNSL